MTYIAESTCSTLLGGSMGSRVRFFLLLLAISSVSAFSQAPPPPANLRVAPSMMAGGVLLIWDSTSPGPVGYRVYKAADDKPFEWIGSTDHRGFSDWHIYPDHLYHYYVTAVNLHG